MDKKRNVIIGIVAGFFLLVVVVVILFSGQGNKPAPPPPPAPYQPPPPPGSFINPGFVFPNLPDWKAPKFKWVKDSGIYTKWRQGEPSGGEDVLRMHDDGTWSDIPWSYIPPLHALCMKENGELTLTKNKHNSGYFETTLDCAIGGAKLWRPLNADENEKAMKLTQGTTEKSILLNPGGSKLSVLEPFADISSVYW